MTAAQQEQLFQCLLNFINPAFEQAKDRQVRGAVSLGKTKSRTVASIPVFTPQHVEERHVVDEQIDDTLIPFRLGPKGEGRRLSDGDEDLNDVFKRTKGLPDDSASQKIIDAMGSVPVMTRHTGPDTWPTVARPIPIGASNSLPETAAVKVPDIPHNISADDRAEGQQGRQPETANNSFISNASVLSSVFNEDISDVSDESFFSAHNSVMDTSDRRWQPDREPPVEVEYTQYGSSIDNFEIIDVISFTPENVLRERLQNVFRKSFHFSNIMSNPSYLS